MSVPIAIPARSGSASGGSAAESHLSFTLNESFIDCSHALPSMPEEETSVLPVESLPGEKLSEQDVLRSATLFQTNYRLILCYNDPPNSRRGAGESIPVTFIDTVDSKPQNEIHIMCKDARIIRLQMASTEQSLVWYKKLMALTYARNLSELFMWTLSSKREGLAWLKDSPPEYEVDMKREFTRLKLDPDHFCVSDFNSDYSLCASYPRELIMPSKMTRQQIDYAKTYRFHHRLPTVVWHDPNKSTILLRSAQPRASILNLWRNNEDENILKAVNDYTRSRRPGDEASVAMNIWDMRSYTAALSNQIKGGGYESAECYDRATLRFSNLPNIHEVMNNFNNLRSLFTPPIPQSGFLSTLDGTRWLENICLMLSSANNIADRMTVMGENVLVHCSDGWDRTTQVVTLVKILCDPYYRTIEGMERLIRVDWIGFGHKFADRNAVLCSMSNERSPVFLQWLDAVYQIHFEHSTKFEYTKAYLVKLAQHAHSCLFTSFAFNTVKEMEEACKGEGREPLPLWSYLNADHEEFVNELYDHTDEPVRAPAKIQAMQLFHELYRAKDCESKASHNEEAASSANVVQAATNGDSTPMDRSIVRSRSTESVAELSMTNPQSPSSHRSPPSHDSPESADLDVSILCRQGTRSSTNGSAREEHTLIQREEASLHDLKALLDVDGLYKVKDSTQESARKRRTNDRGMTSAPSRSHLTSTRSDGTAEETFAMDEEARDGMSDLSIIPQEICNDLPKNSGTWSVNSTRCKLCKSAFAMAFNPAHHCDVCMCEVCDGCSRGRFARVEGSRSVSKRACDECYSKMTGAREGEEETEEEEEGRKSLRGGSEGLDMSLCDSPSQRDSPSLHTVSQKVKG